MDTLGYLLKGSYHTKDISSNKNINMLQLITTPEDIQGFIEQALYKAYQKLPLIEIGKNPVEIVNSATLMERLDISEPTLKRWKEKGKIPFMQIGTAARYDWYKVLEALEVKKTQRA